MTDLLDSLFARAKRSAEDWQITLSTSELINLLETSVTMKAHIELLHYETRTFRRRVRVKLFLLGVASATGVLAFALAILAILNIS